MTREAKAKKWFENTSYTYIEYNNNKEIWLYWLDEEGDWEERIFDKNKVVFYYICYKTTNCMKFMNIIHIPSKIL